MKAKRLIAGLLILSVTASTACIDKGSVFAPMTESSEVTNKPAVDYSPMTPEEICKSLTLEQKAAQMMQPTIYNVDASEMRVTDYGSILSRKDDFPMPTAEEWKKTVTDYQTNALQNEAPIPFIYGNDSVH
jgi:beta-glucosidase